MYDGNVNFGWNGNSFSDCSLMHVDAPVRPVAHWKFGIHPAASIRGEGMV